MKEFSKAFNKIIAECNNGMSVSFSDNMMRQNRIEDYKHHQFKLDKVCLSAMKRHILNESIFRNVDELLNDIMSRIENEEYEFTYSKNDIVKFMCGFNYEEKLKNEVPEKFRLSIICATREKFYDRFSIQLMADSIAEEVLDLNDEWHEMIVIPISKYRHRYGVLKEYIKEELRHVWTYVFGMVDDASYAGRIKFDAEDMLDESKFNSYQKQVLRDMYYNDLNALQKDYDYIFKVQNGNAENWELSVHIDAIIDMLIDYYDGTMSTEKYIQSILNDVRKNALNMNNKMLYDFYTNKNPDFKPMKDNISRLFMLYAFGNDKQIKYFEDECRKEFGNSF